MNWAKARIILGGGILAAACSGQTVAAGDGGAGASDGGSSGTSDGSSGTSGTTSGASGTTSGASGASGTTSGSTGSTSGSTGTVVCGAHDTAGKGSSNDCSFDDAVQCGAAGTINDKYEVVCRCTPTMHNSCDCIKNGAVDFSLSTIVTCPACDPTLIPSVFKACGYPY